MDVLNMLLPTNTSVYNCEHIPANALNYTRSYRHKKNQFDNFIAKNYEPAKIGGNSGGFASEYKFYFHLAKQPWVKTICETGFLAGHSAFQWLVASSNSTKLYSFDLCSRYSYTNTMAAYINETFPNRFNLACGDSAHTVPMATHLYGKCDLVIIDGGHSFPVAWNDITNMQKLANMNGHILLADDVPSKSGSTSAWNKAKNEDILKETFICRSKDVDGKKRGFAVGIYKIELK